MGWMIDYGCEVCGHAWSETSEAEEMRCPKCRAEEISQSEPYPVAKLPYSEAKRKAREG